MGNQNMFALSTWDKIPSFMRVNPIIHWNCGNVWEFLLYYKLPYCVLYDIGYTSLGTIKDTLPCPALLRNDNNEKEEKTKNKYYPAYMLKDYNQERAGRISKREKRKENDTNKIATTTNCTTSNNNKKIDNNQKKNNLSSSAISVSGETTTSTETMSSVGSISTSTSVPPSL